MATDVLWELLKEREPRESISHKGMPPWEHHVAFIASRPYEAWYLIEVGPYSIGACNLTKKREIGIAILKLYRGKGYASQALRMLMEAHPGTYVANINPANEASKRLFRKLGFKGPIQEVYVK